MTNMQPYNSFFREKEPAKQEALLRQRNVKAIILFLVSAAYGLFAFFIIEIKMRGHSGVSILALYAYGLIGGFGFLLLKQIFTDADRSRRILTEVLEKSAEARAITDPEGETIYTNLRFNHLVAETEHSSLVSFSKIFEHPQKITKALDDLRARALSAGMATAEFHTKIKEKHLWFLVTCQHITGWPGYMHWRFDDISSRYQLEAAIREEREKLRDFTDNAPVGFFSVGDDGKFLFANDTFFRLVGTDSEKLIGKMSLHQFLADPPGNGKPYDCFDGGGDHQYGELMMKDTDGRMFKTSVTHSITMSEEGGIISRSIVYDLTSEQKMQQALRESEDRFQRLFEEAPVGICMLSADGIISDANQALAAILHLPISSIDGQPLVNYIGKESQMRVSEWLQRLSRSDRAERFIEVSLKGGQEIVTQLYARKFSGSDSFVLHFIDLTEQKNLEKQFTQSQKMQAVGQLAGGIAHDFNNLLTAMIGFCDLLLLRHKPGDPSFADIMQIKQNANRAANLVRQLLAFSRQQTLLPRVLDLTDVLTELSHLLRRLIGSNIDLRMAHGTDLGLIKADQGQMEQVLINLVVNARDAMPQGGLLQIRTENFNNKTSHKLSGEEILPPGEWVAITVKDSGTGIAPETLLHIFEPFFSTKDVGAGTGLGLATVHGIIHQTGGYIAVNTAVGKGTTFTLYLPRHKEVAGEKAAAVIEEKPVIHDLTGSSQILLVEDEDAVRIFSARALGNKGYQVVDAPSAAVALQLLEDKKIDPEILITDVMMPEMDGTTLAKIVREKYPQIKIIFISGYAEDRFKEHLGAHVYFLPKPFTLKQLATKVKEVIEDK
jgi:two-component system cell cycle sensor histidine kinase/response regulator CckA